MLQSISQHVVCCIQRVRTSSWSCYDSSRLDLNNEIWLQSSSDPVSLNFLIRNREKKTPSRTEKPQISEPLHTDSTSDAFIQQTFFNLLIKTVIKSVKNGKTIRIRMLHKSPQTKTKIRFQSLQTMISLPTSQETARRPKACVASYRKKTLSCSDLMVWTDKTHTHTHLLLSALIHRASITTVYISTSSSDTDCGSGFGLGDKPEAVYQSELTYRPHARWRASFRPEAFLLHFPHEGKWVCFTVTVTVSDGTAASNLTAELKITLRKWDKETHTDNDLRLNNPTKESALDLSDGV